MKRHFFLTLITLLLAQNIHAIQTSISHHPERLIESLKEDPKAGEKVYLEFCAVCHDPDPQIPLGAPRIGVSADWKHRKKNLEEMTKSVAEGLNTMPARGGCFECSDALLEAAVQYLLPKEKASKAD